MEIHTIAMKSSTAGLYEVAVELDSGQVRSLKCDCQAGTFGDFCKHVKAFFEGNRSALFDSDLGLYMTQNFLEICEILQSSPLAQAYEQMNIDLASIDLNQKALKQAAKTVKSNFVRKLRGKI